jgi:hypothetical protein
MRFVCGDVRDLIVSHKTDHGPAHRRYRALQQWSCLKICFREIFGIVPFSTFATKSARSGSRRAFLAAKLLVGRRRDDFNDRATLPVMSAKSMRGWRPCSRKANPEAFDKARNAAHVHVERVARAERREPLRIRGPLINSAPSPRK